MNNINPLYRVDKSKYEFIYNVIVSLHQSYLYASGGQKWEMDEICNGDKELSAKYFRHWKNVFNKVEDMVQNKLMFDKADIILSTDPVLILVQKHNYKIGRSRLACENARKEALYYYNQLRNNNR